MPKIALFDASSDYAGLGHYETDFLPRHGDDLLIGGESFRVVSANFVARADYTLDVTVSVVPVLKAKTDRELDRWRKAGLEIDVRTALARRERFGVVA